MRVLYQHAYTWGWHDNDPFDMFESRYIRGITVGKRQPKGVIKKDKVTDITPADEYYRMTKYDKAAPSIKKNIVTWWIMRYTCAHIGEAEGIVWEDIDFNKKTIRIQANSVRELKTEQRGRELPLLEPLYKLLLKHKRHTKGISGSIHGLPDNIDRRKLGKVMKTICINTYMDLMVITVPRKHETTEILSSKLTTKATQKPFTLSMDTKDNQVTQQQPMVILRLRLNVKHLNYC